MSFIAEEPQLLISYPTRDEEVYRNRVQGSLNSVLRPRLIDLFSGAGGMTLGFRWGSMSLRVATKVPNMTARFPIQYAERFYIAMIINAKTAAGIMVNGIFPIRAISNRIM